jgi:hypothetical protein
VVRVKTTFWSDKRGIHTKKSLLYLRRQCTGFNLLEEDSGAMSAEEVLVRIVNLDEIEEGIYRVIACNEHRDLETGCIDDYDYQLIPV